MNRRDAERRAELDDLGGFAGAPTHVEKPAKFRSDAQEIVRVFSVQGPIVSSLFFNQFSPEILSCSLAKILQQRTVRDLSFTKEPFQNRSDWITSKGVHDYTPIAIIMAIIDGTAS
jgi:hypothetical protein